MRVIYFCLGWIMVALGVIGIVTPLLPTTIFLIIAAWSFGKSSPRLEAWMLNHPQFGPPLRRWREHGAVPKKAKFAAVGGMTLGYVMFWFGAKPSPLLAVIVALFLIASATYVVTRPTFNETGETTKD